MFSRQKAIGWPRTTVSMPRSWAKAAVDNAYGPAPMTSSSVAILELDANLHWIVRRIHA